MSNLSEQKIQILKGQIEGVVIPFTDSFLKNQRYCDYIALSDEDFKKKWSPYHNPDLRLNDTQIEIQQKDAELFAQMFNQNGLAYKSLMK